MTIKRCYPVLVGASVVENQLVQNGNFADTSGWTTYGTTFTTSNNEATITFPSTRTGILGQQVSFTTGHKYLTAVSIKGDATYSAIYCMLGSGLAVHEYDISTTYKREQFIFNYNSTSNNFNILRTNASNSEKIYIKNAVLIDITAMLGSTIADYIYSLETATAGSGIAWLRSYGFINDAYIPYNAGTIESVEATAKVVRDENGENTITYSLGNDTLRGIFKLDANNQLYADGDTKTSDGVITRHYGIRAYQSGDESLPDAITDGTTTVYKLTTPTTEQGDPFTSPQVCYPEGTEEFVTENGVPVGHETKYQL